MNRRTLIGAAAVVLAALCTASGASAQDQAIDTQAQELYDEVMSPFCPGRTLANCPSPQAARLRDQIKERLAAGATGDEVKEELYEAYGEVVLGAPQARGFGLVAWIVPGLFIVAGAVVLVLWIASMKRQTVVDAAAAADMDFEARARLESELSQL
jgi:cytochrome c-type biogenesis protein CcmH